MDVFMPILPNRFYSNLASKESRLASPFGIVGLFVLLNTFALWVWGNRLSYSLELGQARTVFVLTYSVTISAGAIGGLIAWPLYSALFHVVGSVFPSKRVTYRKVLECVGYAHIPLVIYSVALLAWLAVDYRPVSLDLRTAEEGLKTLPFMQFVQYARSVGYLWAGWLVSVSMRELFGLSWWYAVWSTAVPGAVLVAISKLPKLLIS